MELFVVILAAAALVLFAIEVFQTSGASVGAWGGVALSVAVLIAHWVDKL